MINKLTIGFKPLGGSAGTGEQIASLTESAVAVFCAIRQSTRDNVEMSRLKNDGNRYRGSFAITSTTDEIQNKLDKSWEYSCQEVSRVIIRELSKFSGRYVFHRGSPVSLAINAKFLKVNCGAFSNVNKWCPADLWAVKDGFRINLTPITTLAGFNEYLKAELERGNLIGISLKKTRAPTAKYQNIDGKKKDIKFRGLTIATTGRNITASKSIYISASRGAHDYKIECRSFNNLSYYGGEISGAHANHGKLAYSVIATILYDVLSLTIPTAQLIKQRVMSKDESIMTNIYLTLNKIEPQVITFTDFKNQTADKTPDWFWSRMLGAIVADCISTASTNQRDEIVDRMLSYAASASPLSAPFLKVS